MKPPTGSAWLIALLGTFLAAALGQTAAPPRPHVDILGDPLPPGALARIGTSRLRCPGRCWGVAITPDGKSILSNGDGLTFWDIKTGKPIRHFDMGAATYPSPFSRDGKILLAAKHLIGVLAVDPLTGEVLQRFGRPADLPESKSRHGCALAPDGKTVALGWGDKTVRLYDVATGKERFVLRGLAHLPQCLVFTPDSLSIIAGERVEGDNLDDKDIAHSILVWNVATGKLRHRLTGYLRPIHGLTCSPDNRFLTSVTVRCEEVWVWDLTTGKQSRRLPLPHGNAYDPVFSPDGRTLAVSRHGDVILLDWPSGRVKQTLDIPGYTHVAFTPDGRTVAGVAEDDQSIYLWDVATGKKRVVPEGHGGAISWATLAPDGRTLAAASADCSVRLWEVATGKLLRTVGTFQGMLRGMAFSQDGRFLAWAAEKPYHENDPGSTLTVCELAAGRCHSAKLRGSLWHPRFSADSRYLVLVGGGRMHFWDVQKGKEVSLLAVEDETGQAALFAPDGRTLAVTPKPARGQQQAEIQLWDLKSGKMGTTLITPVRVSRPSFLGAGVGGAAQTWLAASSLGFTPDSRLLAAGDHFGRVHIWDTATSTLRRAWQAHEKEPTFTLGLSPDGKLVATATNWRNKTVRIWEVATGKEVLRLPNHHGTIHQLAFLPDGQRLLTAGAGDGTALVWDLLGLPNLNIPSVKDDINPKEAETLWQTIGQPDAAGFRVMLRLVRTPRSAVALLRAKLRPVPAPDRPQIQRLIQQLDADSLSVRDNATRQLQALAELAVPQLRQALKGKPSAETKRRINKLLALSASPELLPGQLRRLRAVQTLEWIGSKEARTVLQRLAEGEPMAALTQDAKFALQRLQRDDRR